MNKNRFRKSFLTVLEGAIFCLAILSLSSCENFLKGAEVREQLEKIIEEANAPSVDVYMVIDKNAGILAPNGILSYKVGQTFNVYFNPEDGVKFVRWQAIDRITGQELPQAVVFENPKLPETKATLKQEVSNLQIKPLYVELPRVVSCAPSYSDYGSVANSSIVITFNIPMVNEDADNIFSFDNVSVTSGSTNMAQFFDAPEISKDYKTLSIKPKGLDLKNYMEQKSLSTMEIRVSLDSAKIKVLAEGTLNTLRETDKTTFKYKIRAEVETEPPTKVSPLIVTRSAINMSNASSVQDTLPAGIINTNITGDNAITREQIWPRRVAKYIYIYGKYFDADTGVKELIVKEKQINKRNGEVVVNPWVTGNITDLQIVRDEDGIAEFCFKYEFVSDDGAIQLSIAPIDYGDNTGEKDVYTVIKNNTLNLSSLYVYNLYRIVQTGGSADYYYTIDQINSNVRIIKVNDENYPSLKGLRIPIYGNEIYTHEDLSVYYNFDKQGYKKMDWALAGSSGRWTVALDPGVSISGKTFNVKVVDDLGNEAVQEGAFPTPPVVSNITSPATTSRKYTFSSNAAFTGVTLVKYNKLKKYFDISTQVFSNQVNNYLTVDRGDVEIYAILQNNSLCGPVSEYQLSNSADVYTTNSSTTYLTPTSVYWESNGVGTGQFTITVTINSAAWNRYDQIYIDNVSFIKPNTSCTFTMDNRTLWYSGKTINVYGVKNNVVYGPGTYTISPLGTLTTSLITDSTNPEFYTSNNGIDSMFPNGLTTLIDCGCMDEFSGIKEIKWQIGDSEVQYYLNKDYPDDDYYSTDNLAYYIPVYDMDESSCIIKVTATDNDNNTVTVNKVKNFYDNLPELIPTRASAASTTYYLAANGVPEEWYKWKYCIYQFNGAGWVENKKMNWQKMTGYIDCNQSHVDPNYVKPTLSTRNGLNFYSYPNVTISTNGYYKIITTSDLVEGNASETGGADCCFGVSAPYYFYHGTKSSGAATDFLVSSDSSPYLYFVGSDQPVLLTTVITKKPLSECSSWDYDRWNRRHKVVQEKQLAFTPSDTSFKSYYVDSTKIPEGYCYIVIAHYADGHEVMGEARQK